MKKLIGTFAFLLAWSVFADKPAVHGMLVFGNKAIYVSHLPMFHAPHDYQFVSEVHLKDLTGGDVVERYREEWQNEKLFTIAPEKMDLAPVVKGTRTRFTATLYKGHFEREGAEILGDVEVEIVHKLIANKIAPRLGPSSSFLSFGRDGEYFLVHMIKGKPAFDAVYLTDAPYAITRRECSDALCPAPEKTPLNDHELPAAIVAPQAQIGVHPEDMVLGTVDKTQIVVTKPFYAEYNDLKHQ